MSLLILDYAGLDIGTPPASKNGYEPGAFILVKDNVLDKLKRSKKGEERMSYFMSPEFTDSIICTYNIMYNPKKDICVLEGGCNKVLNEKTIKELENAFSKNTTFWTSIPVTGSMESDVKALANIGFSNPYITSKSPLKTKIPISMAFTRAAETRAHSSDFIIEKAKDVFRQKDEKICSVKLKFSKKSIALLKKAPKIGKVGNSQREITGELYPSRVEKKQGGTVYIIDPDLRSIESGEEENVTVAPTRYNFHSHPYEAYIRHDVKKAWPSVTDYLGYRDLAENTIFHAVATLEGVYIMSFTPYWADRIDEISRNFIDKNYDIDHKEKYTPIEYTKKVNSILYKGKPIYKVIYIAWKDIEKPFSVYFSKIGESCMHTQKTVDAYRKLHD